MRSLLIAAALAVVAFAASAPVRAESTHWAGGPMTEGRMCWASTQSDLGYGYWRACPKPEKPMKMKKK